MARNQSNTILILSNPIFIHQICIFRVLRMYSKVHYLSKKLRNFTLKPYTFSQKNIAELCNSLSPADKELFNFDMTTVNWRELLFVILKGLRTFYAKDPMDTLPVALQRLKM